MPWPWHPFILACLQKVTKELNDSVAAAATAVAQQHPYAMYGGKAEVVSGPNLATWFGSARAEKRKKAAAEASKWGHLESEWAARLFGVRAHRVSPVWLPATSNAVACSWQSRVFVVRTASSPPPLLLRHNANDASVLCCSLRCRCAADEELKAALDAGQLTSKEFYNAYFGRKIYALIQKHWVDKQLEGTQRDSGDATAQIQSTQQVVRRRRAAHAAPGAAAAAAAAGDGRQGTATNAGREAAVVAVPGERKRAREAQEDRQRKVRLRAA